MTDEGDILEVKLVTSYRSHEFGEPGSDQVPPGIALQVHHQLACVPDAKQAHVAVFLGNLQFHRFVIPRDPETIASIEDIEADFWQNHVIPRIPPELDGSDAATDYLRATYPTDDGTELVATDDLEELVSQYSIARQMRESHAEEEEVLKQKVIEAIGDASRLVGQRFTISYKLAKGYDVTDYKAVVSEVRPPADVLAKYTSLREGVRRFVYTAKEGA
jgi:predicted phage-related endonuclease